MTRAEWEAAKARCEAASPGPWRAIDDCIDDSNETTIGQFADYPPDAQFVAHARTDLPKVLDMLGETMALLIEYGDRRSGWMPTALDEKADALLAKWEGQK